MNSNGVSDFQLYVLSKNGKLAPEIGEFARSKFVSRRNSDAQLKQIEQEYLRLFKPDNSRLSPQIKTLLVLLPIVGSFGMFFAGHWLARRQKRRWQEFWAFLSIGYLLWTILAILIAKFWLF